MGDIPAQAIGLEPRFEGPDGNLPKMWTNKAVTSQVIAAAQMRPKERCMMNSAQVLDASNCTSAFLPSPAPNPADPQT